ncbi:MAG TPA: hypothetical protein VHY91_07735 [Pirellulales bacterium]|jgi:hypothetical protein|nr:hypothetical protein [Pirellulales bacterium]
MSRLGTVGLCALALAIFVPVVKGDESGGTAKVVAAARPDSTRPIDVGSPHETLARAKFMRVLAEPTHFEYNELPLNDVVVDLKNRHHIEIQLDVKVLEEASIGIDTPVTRNLQDVTLRSGLRLMLGALDLTYIIKDEVLLITTPDKASNELMTRIYPVGDLATPRNAALGGEDLKPLIAAIVATIAPTTWDEVGGPGSIVPLSQARSLIVSQTDEVHEQITELLAGLRQARDAQPSARITILGSFVDGAAEFLRHRKPGRGNITPGSGVW